MPHSKQGAQGRNNTLAVSPPCAADRRKIKRRKKGECRTVGRAHTISHAHPHASAHPHGRAHVPDHPHGPRHHRSVGLRPCGPCIAHTVLHAPAHTVSVRGHTRANGRREPGERTAEHRGVSQCPVSAASTSCSAAERVH
eukprot:7381701-Prymnesium_polylepis.1